MACVVSAAVAELLAACHPESLAQVMAYEERQREDAFFRRK